MLWGEFDAATQAHGLHAPGGRVTTTGIGGFTTGGGYGWTSSKYGLACDILVSAEVVLADGSVVTASATEHWRERAAGLTRHRRRMCSTCSARATPCSASATSKGASMTSSGQVSTMAVAQSIHWATVT